MRRSSLALTAVFLHLHFPFYVGCTRATEMKSISPKKSLLSSPDSMVKGLSLGDKLSNYGKNKGDKYSFGLLYQNSWHILPKKLYTALGSRKHRQKNTRSICNSFVEIRASFCTAEELKWYGFLKLRTINTRKEVYISESGIVVTIET